MAHSVHAHAMIEQRGAQRSVDRLIAACTAVVQRSRRLRSETLFAELQLFILLRNQSISLSVNQSINRLIQATRPTYTGSTQENLRTTNMKEKNSEILKSEIAERRKEQTHTRRVRTVETSLSQ